MSYVVRPDGTIVCESPDEAIDVSRRLRAPKDPATPPRERPTKQARAPSENPPRRFSPTTLAAPPPPAPDPGLEVRTCVRCKRTFALEPDEPRGRNVRRTCLELDCCRGPIEPVPDLPLKTFAVPSYDDVPIGKGTA